VLVLVGATIVGSMATVWHGVVNPPRPAGARLDYDDREQAVTLDRGAEMGRFLLGSTVVLLFPPGRCASTRRGRPAAPSAWARRWPQADAAPAVSRPASLERGVRTEGL
jgi:phosphatidylserine decarboxylase